jgi:hypothetical protein
MNDLKKDESLFRLILFYLLVRSSSTESEIYVHHAKLTTEKHKEIQKRNQDFLHRKPIRQRNRPKERDEHPDQYQQQHR